MSEYREALKALQIAENHFENADSEHIEAAIFEVNYARQRLDAFTNLKP